MNLEGPPERRSHCGKSDGEAVKRDMTTKPREIVDLIFFGEEIVDQV